MMVPARVQMAKDLVQQPWFQYKPGMKFIQQTEAGFYELHILMLLPDPTSVLIATIREWQADSCTVARCLISDFEAQGFYLDLDDEATIGTLHDQMVAAKKYPEWVMFHANRHTL